MDTNQITAGLPLQSPIEVPPWGWYLVVLLLEGDEYMTHIVTRYEDALALIRRSNVKCSSTHAFYLRKRDDAVTLRRVVAARQGDIPGLVSVELEDGALLIQGNTGGEFLSFYELGTPEAVD